MKKPLLSSLLFIFYLMGLHAQTTILDFESPATTTTFEYFGSSNPGGLMDISIANPDASGINTSATVAEFTKPAGSESWAGAYGDVSTLMDFTTNNAICLKVWVTEPTNLNLKLENGDASLNWELAKQIDVTNTWVEVCYNTTGQIAEGQVYNRLVLFFDFNQVLGAEKTYYFDDVVTTTAAAELYDITFSVDMNNYTESFDTVFVSGTMNNWAGDANPLADDDGDGVWTGTIADLSAGNYEYKFTLDNWTEEEDFSGAYYTCTLTTGENTNRIFSLAENTALPTVCFNSCYTCGAAAMLTVRLGEGNATPSAEGFFIAGGGNFGNPGDFALKASVDGNGNGVHSGRFERPMGFSSFYTFTNGACPDYSCKENIAGQGCSNPDNFDDRFMDALTEDMTIIACFAECSNTIGGGDCVGALPIELAAFTGQNINGVNQLAWKTATEQNSDFFEIQKSADGVNFTRIGTVDAAGTSSQILSYTFLDEETFIGDSYYRLRMVDLDGTFAYSKIVRVAMRLIDDIAVYPVPANHALSIVYDTDNSGTISIEIVDAIGQSLFLRKETIGQGINTFQLDINQLSRGSYFIHLINENGQSKVRPFIKN